mmetsp:Transcript_62013/g.139885  ORF Transcript_62013/g.139885 Transcript_62013/m.139885 type:complete len:220 (+) Transcript_62013:1973-2632(+)
MTRAKTWKVQLIQMHRRSRLGKSRSPDLSSHSTSRMDLGRRSTLLPPPLARSLRCPWCAILAHIASDGVCPSAFPAWGRMLPRCLRRRPTTTTWVSVPSCRASLPVSSPPKRGTRTTPSWLTRGSRALAITARCWSKRRCLPHLACPGGNSRCIRSSVTYLRDLGRPVSRNSTCRPSKRGDEVACRVTYFPDFAAPVGMAPSNGGAATILVGNVADMNQ